MKKQFILVLGLLMYVASQAQEKGSYIDLNVGGGFHNLSYTLQNGTEKGQFGYTLNAGYSYFFTPEWGLHTGLGLQSFNSLSTLNFLQSTPNVVDADGALYTFKANYINWQEKQQVLFVDLPLEIQYKHFFGNKIGLLAGLGGKISMPIMGNYKAAGGKFVTTGYYPQYNVELSDMPQHGFSTFTNGFSGDLSVKPSFMAIADIGGLYELSEGLDLYVGAYVNYGLNNILKADSKLIYQPDGLYNGLFASNQTNSVTPISIGLKVGLSLRLGGEEKPIISLEKSVEPVLSIRPVETVQPVITEKPVEAVQAVEPVKPVEVVKPVEAVQPVETVKPFEVIKPVEPVQQVQPKEPVKAEAPVVVPPVAEPAPKVVELPKEVKVEQPVQTVLPVESVKSDDMFIEAQKIATSMNLMFQFNSYQVENAKNDKIKELSDILKTNPDIHLLLVGHTCNIGTHRVNLILGKKRAISVKQKFIKQGVSEAQLSTESKAYDQPLVPNTSRANRAKNRRVEIKVIKQN
jgi:outer membrane protein OmpA-like peptidoglycan-associated protein